MKISIEEVKDVSEIRGFFEVEDLKDELDNLKGEVEDMSFVSVDDYDFDSFISSNDYDMDDFILESDINNHIQSYLDCEYDIMDNIEKDKLIEFIIELLEKRYGLLPKPESKNKTRIEKQ